MQVAGAAIATTLGNEFVPHGVKLVVNAFDKVGFDTDHIGRERRIQEISQAVQMEYEKKGCHVNIMVWNMHLKNSHQLDGLVQQFSVKMGNGGGFNVEVFTGGGYFENQGAHGFDNWRGSGNQKVEGNRMSFSKR